MLIDLKIKTKLNSIVFIAVFFVGFFLLVNYFSLNGIRESVSEMTANELLIKNTSNQIIKELFLLNITATENLQEKNSNDLDVRQNKLNADILTDIAVIHTYAIKYKKDDLIKNINNVQIRYESYFNMIKGVTNHNITTNSDDIVEIELAINSILNRTIDELENLIFISEKNFNQRLEEIGSDMENYYNTIILISFIGMVFLVLINSLFKNQILRSMENLKITVDYFVSLLDGKNLLEEYEVIKENTEIGNIIKQMNDKVPLVKDNIQKLKELAIKDTLTGLYNRRFLQEHTEYFIAKAKRDKSKMGILVLDIDYFKMINDTYGHDVGDIVLKIFSNLILSCIRESDVAVRYGGEEFIVILTNIVNDADILKIAHKINTMTSTLDIQIDDTTVLQKTVSIGVAIFPNDADNMDALITKADVALYLAKNNGRNQVVYVD